MDGLFVVTKQQKFFDSSHLTPFSIKIAKTYKDYDFIWKTNLTESQCVCVMVCAHNCCMTFQLFQFSMVLQEVFLVDLRP